MLPAEWIKLRTLRATFWTNLLTVVLCVGLSALVCLSFASGAAGDFDPLFPTYYGLTMGQLPLVVFGVLAVSSEYTGGTIRSSLAAMPSRTRFYGAKIAAIGMSALAVSAVTVALTFGTAQTVLGDKGVGWDWRSTVGATLYLTLMCLFAAGITAMLRSAAITLAVLMPLLFLGSQGLGNLPKVKAVAQYLPDQAGWVILHLTGPDPAFARDYGPWTGLGITALWAAAALAGGLVLLRRRDA